MEKQITEGIYENKACLESERLALLEVKAFLDYSVGYNTDHLFPSWKDDPGSECCDWERVLCDHGHVIELSLDSIEPVHKCHTDSRSLFYICSIYYNKKINRLFNISMLHQFNELLLLNLSNNGITGWTNNKASEGLWTLKKLETLDLSWNEFDDSIISSLKGFEHSSKPSKLKHLDLSGNRISENMFIFFGKILSMEYLDFSSNYYNGPFPFYELSGLRNLKVLKLNSNRINGTLSIQNRTALSKLQVLELADNLLDGISSELGILSSLKALSLSENGLNDTAIPGLCGFIHSKTMEELNLGNNSFTVIPQCFHNLTSLKLLDLSQNDINGKVPSLWISRLTSLKYFDFMDNNFGGSFSFSTFKNHSQLEIVRISSDNSNFTVETEDVDWSPNFQLKFLVLSKCNLNMNNHEVPNFLLQQHKLRFVDLSHNNLQGNFPSWLLTNNSRMENLYLNNNSFTGGFYLPLYPMMDLTSIDISKNQIQGKIPKHLGNALPNLKFLKLSDNAFLGNLPFSVGLMTELKVLDLSSNNFSGKVPQTLFNCTRLVVLKLSNNSFSEEFFPPSYNLGNLRVLQLNNNKFTGSMSNVEVNSRKLFLFDMSDNNMSGKVPTWIANTGMSILNLRNNSLEGTVPCEGFAAMYVDLSYNFLSGEIPSCSFMENLVALHLQSNNFSGSIPRVLLNSSSISLLNLRDNRLSGGILDKVGVLSSLRVFLLGANEVNGLIPENLCLSKDISQLDLSSNSFSGPIPSCLSNMKFDEIHEDNLGNQLLGHDSMVELTVFLNLVMGLKMDDIIGNILPTSKVQIQIDFITKNRYNTYKGDIRNFVSGLDLSSNNLEGEIPPGLGFLSKIRSINMSHNRLSGSIPITFSNLAQVESLDLSHNNLSGEIPHQLTQLTFLGVFSVAYNDLSGRIPFGKGQFDTFGSNSYEGNQLLCGQPLEKNCNGDNKPTPPSVGLLPDNDDRNWNDIDLKIFFPSFLASFVVFFSGVITFLYLNLYWQQWAFYYGQKIVFSCYYFISDILFTLYFYFRRF